MAYAIKCITVSIVSIFTAGYILSNLRYLFEVSNALGSASGTIHVTVLTKEERETRGLKVDLSAKHLESNSVKVNDFGKYVEGLHSTQNSDCIAQFEVLHNNYITM